MNQSANNHAKSIALIVGVFLLPIFCYESKADPLLSDVTKDIDASMQKHRYAQSLLLANSALKYYPNSAAILCKAGRCSINLEKYEEARKYRDRALLQSNLTSNEYLELTKISCELDELAEAIKIAQTALDKFPQTPALMASLGENLHRAGKLEESRRLFDRFLQIDKSNFGVWLRYMNILAELKDWRALVQAGDEMSKVAKTQKGTINSIIYGRCIWAKSAGYMHLSDWKQARVCLEEALPILPLERKLIVDHLAVCKKLNDQVAIAKDQARLAAYDDGM